MRSLLVRVGAPEQTALVLSVPHGGRSVPIEFRSGLRPDPMDLWSDWYTDDLYDFGFGSPVPTVIARLSRFVADPNRDPEGPLHGSFWNTVVPAADPWDSPLYRRPLGHVELETRIAFAHRPYHEALDRLITRSLQHHARVLLLDLHSFGLPLTADVIIGDRQGASASPAVSAAVAHAFTGAGFHVERNKRFTGGHIISRYIEDDRVDAVQLELNQRRYLVRADVEVASPRPRRGDVSWQQTRASLRRAVTQLAR